jgi:fructose-1,6-bisphosphatase
VDVYANEVFIQTLNKSWNCMWIASEENDDLSQ